MKAFLLLFLACAAHAVPPSTPANPRLSPTIHDGAAFLEWDANPGGENVSYYRIWRSSDPFPNDHVAITTTSSTNFLNLGLTNNVTYYFSLSAVNNLDEESPRSAAVSIWTHPPIPKPPLNFRIVSVTSHTILWGWTDQSGPGDPAEEDGFRIRSSTGGADISGNLPAGTTQFLETGLVPGGEYIRFLESFNITASSRAETAGSLTLLSTQTRVNPPDNFSFAFIGTSIAFQWGANFNHPSVQYDLERSSEGAVWHQAVTTTSLSHTLTGLVEGTQLYFRLRSRSSGNFSLSPYLSAISTTVARMAPSSVSEISALTGAVEGQLNIEWRATGDDAIHGDLAPPARFGLAWSSNPAHAFSHTALNMAITTTASAGSMQRVGLNGLNGGVTYYVAVFTQDDSGHWSGVSSIATGWAQRDITPPSIVNIIQASLLGATSAQIAWKSPGDDGQTGLFNGIFFVGYSTVPLTSDAIFEQFATKMEIVAVSTPGVALSTVVAGFSAENGIYFGIRAMDDAGNKSTIVPENQQGAGGGGSGGSGGGSAGGGSGGGGAGTSSGTVSFAVDNVPPPEVLFFTATPDPGQDGVIRLNWLNPISSDLDGNVLLRNTSQPPNASLIPRGSVPFIGQIFSDGSVVIDTPTVISNSQIQLIQTGLSIGSTYYYTLVTRDAIDAQLNKPNYSSGVSATARAKDALAPAEPHGVEGEIISGSVFRLRWRAPAYNANGVAFTSPSSPHIRELEYFEIYASSALDGVWTMQARLSASTTQYSAAGSTGEYWKLKAFDTFGNASRDSMIVSVSREILAASSDGRSFIRLPQEAAAALKGLTLRASQLTQEQGGPVYTAVRFWAEEAGTGKAIAGFSFGQPIAQVILSYAVNSQGQIASLAGPQVSGEPVLEQNAQRQLALYWNDGKQRVNLYGEVDKNNRTVSTRSSHLGTFYVQKVHREQGFDFDTNSVAPKVITPNGDGLNDAVIFRFNNPKDSRVVGKILDLSGAYVADLIPGPVTDSLQWNGRDAAGAAAPSGVYVYQMEAEGRFYNGTVVVAK